MKARNMSVNGTVVDRPYGRGLLTVICVAFCLLDTSRADERELAASPQGAANTTSFVDQIMKWGHELGGGIGKRMADAECCCELYDAMRLQLATVWDRESAERLMGTLSREPKAKQFLGTVEMWRGIVEHVEQSLQKKLDGDARLQIRMVRARFDLPVASDESEVDVIDGAEAVSPSSVRGVLADLTSAYTSVNEESREPDRNGDSCSEQMGRMSLLCVQLNITQKATSHVGATGRMEQAAVPTAWIWIVYDVLKRPGLQRPDQREVLKHVDVQLCKLVYESGGWKHVGDRELGH